MRPSYSKVPVFSVLVCCLLLKDVDSGADTVILPRGLIQLSSMASPYVSYKRCCGCSENFSKKLITCVRYYDKRSDCFSANPGGFNRCIGNRAGSNISRAKGDAISGVLALYCSGFSTCENVNGEVVPQPKCCPDGLCYDPINRECNYDGCNYNPSCEVLPEDERDDCECEPTQAPESECHFMSIRGSVTQFMGVEEMVTYTCPVGTCWDQNVCSCVTTNNTGYNECNEFVDMEFDIDLNARDSRGNKIYTTVHGQVNDDNYVAKFNGNGQLNVVGTANTWYSNDLVMHFSFILEEDDTSSQNENQCFVGNCKAFREPGELDTLAVTVRRDEDASSSRINVFLTYQDRAFMHLENSMGVRDLELFAQYQLDVQYDFWLIYCGSEEVVYAGILEGVDAIAARQARVPGSVQLIGRQTGFLFGDCARGREYEGILDQVEIYRDCKPEGDKDFDTAFDEILDRLQA